LSTEFRWTSGAAYGEYVGRWSRLVAAEFVPWLGVAPGATWIDVGCGTGELSRVVLRLASPSKVIALDPSSGFLEHARATVIDPRVEFLHGNDQDVASLGVSAGAVVSGLVLNFVPDPRAALRAFTSAAGHHAMIGAYVWDYARGMTMLRAFWDAAVEEDPAARSHDEGDRFTICNDSALEALFTSAGLFDVQARAIDVTDRYSHFDEFWTPFLSGQAPAPGYLATLPEARQARVRELTRKRLPAGGGGGSITLTCRAWAVRGRTT
jgi:SAM-dependent methyltransferase